MCQLRSKRIMSLVSISSLPRALHSVMSLNSRLRLYIDNASTVALTRRHTRSLITERIKMYHRRRITGMRQLIRVPLLRKARRKRSLHRLHHHINSRRNRRIITRLRSVTRATTSNMSVLRRQNMLSTLSINKHLRSSILANRNPNRINNARAIDATSNRMYRTIRHRLLNIQQASRTNCLLAEGTMIDIRMIKRRLSLLKCSTLNDYRGRLLLRARHRLLRVLLRM